VQGCKSGIAILKPRVSDCYEFHEKPEGKSGLTAGTVRLTFESGAFT
jgi:hypothetical protein